jgi:hypothetical protein
MNILSTIEKMSTTILQISFWNDKTDFSPKVNYGLSIHCGLFCLNSPLQGE